MSGICGVFSPRDPSLASTELLERMLAAMADRGGDGERTFRDASAGIAIGLTSRRTFLGPAEGPLDAWHDDGGIVAAVDGSIHGAVAAPGTEPNSAAVARAWRDGGFPASLDGYYAAALWDSASQEIALALDSLGSKPLYYYQAPGSGALVFASRLRALIAHPSVPRDIDLLSVQVFLARGSVFAPYSIYEGVRKLLPGEMLRASRGAAARTEVYHRQAAGPVLEGTPQELQKSLRAELTAAVARACRGGQRLGVTLSGGVDSTVLLAAMKDAGAAGIGYTIVYDDGIQVSEAGRAAQAAKAVDMKHEVLRVTSTPDSVFSAVFRHLDEPVEAKRGPTQHLLSEAAAADGIHSCLNGVSGENVYGGMEWGLFEATKERLGSPGAAIEAMLCRPSLIDYDEHAELLAAPVDAAAARARILDPFYGLIDIADPYERYNAALLLRVPTGRHGVPPLMVPPASGVEQRQPFRDQRLVDFGRRLPFALKEGDSFNSSRNLVRNAYADVLPFLLDASSKSGIPAFPWMQPGFDGMDRRLEMSFERLKATGLVRPRGVDKVLKKYRAPGRSTRAVSRAWGLFCLASWYDINVSGFDPFR